MKFKFKLKKVKAIWEKTHPLLKAGAILLFVLIVVNIAYFFASAYSPGCVLCHYMKPYYEQSSHSVHNQFSCVTCHPGRRLLMAPYLLRYIAGSYNPRPRAEVDDDICLDCHEAQNLKKKTAFEMNISFNHNDHLSDLKRGKKLRCTSCHARGEEEHFIIDKNVCFTCHFKGAERGHSVTSCNVCHGIPRQIVQHGGFQFNHESYLKIGVDCSQCHLDVTRGNAEVQKKVCYKCHIERTEEFANVDKIHSTHITKEGVDCEECHNAIEHGRIKMISTLEANCENCHQLKHTLQREMYIGSEGRGVGSIPSRMFAAQVSCEGCHLDLNNDGKSDISEKRQSCVKCHSEGYDRMLDTWIAGINKAVIGIAPAVEYAKQVIASAEKQGKNIKAEQIYLSDAEANFHLVEEGRGVHNLDYAISLLNNIADNIEGIVTRLQNKNYKVNRPLLLTDDKEYCNLCHNAIQSKNIEKFADERFPHSHHMKFVSCSKCHSRSEHKKIIVTTNDCRGCHESFSNIPVNIKYLSINFAHSKHTKEENIKCSVCHENTFDSGDFSNIRVKKNSCAGCHHKTKELRKNCSVCHPNQYNTYSGFVIGEKHEPDIMNSGGVDCEGCHLPNKISVSKPGENVCAGCHDASYTNMKNEWTNEVRSKSGKLNNLVNNLKLKNLTEEEKVKVQKGKKLISHIKADGSGGIHNYMALTSLLDKAIEELTRVETEKK